jgi:hypothetical protein
VWGILVGVISTLANFCISLHQYSKDRDLRTLILRGVAAGATIAGVLFAYNHMNFLQRQNDDFRYELDNLICMNDPFDEGSNQHLVVQPLTTNHRFVA